MCLCVRKKGEVAKSHTRVQLLVQLLLGWATLSVMPRSQLRLLLAAVLVACVAVRHRPVGSWARSVGCAPSRWRLRWRAASAAASERLSRPPPVLRAPPLPTAGTRVDNAARARARGRAPACEAWHCEPSRLRRTVRWRPAEPPPTPTVCLPLRSGGGGCARGAGVPLVAEVVPSAPVPSSRAHTVKVITVHCCSVGRLQPTLNH